MSLLLWRKLAKRGRLSSLRDASQRADGLTVEGFALASTVLFSLLHLLSGQPWLPAEELTLKAPQGLAVGYVVKADDNEYVLLDREHRDLVRLKAERVEARIVCNDRNKLSIFTSPSLGELLFLVDPEGQRKYKACAG